MLTPPSPSYEFQICFYGERLEDKFVRCYLIKVPKLEACPPPSYFSVCTRWEKEKEKQESSPKKLFSLLEVAKFSYFKSFAVVGTHLYSIGGPIIVCHN